MILNAVVCTACAVCGFTLSVITIAKLGFLARNGQLREANVRRDMTLLCKQRSAVVVQYEGSARYAVGGGHSSLVWGRQGFTI